MLHPKSVRGTMLWRSVLVGLLASGTQAFAPSPILLGGSKASGFVIAPRAFPNTAMVLPQRLTIQDRSHKAAPNIVPHFAQNADETISWDGLCIEASGEKSGDVVRINRCTGGPGQKWNWLSSSQKQGHTIQLKGTNKCLDVSDGDGDLHGASIGLKECGIQATKAWRFEEPFTSQGSQQHSALPGPLRPVMISLLALVVLGIFGLGALLWKSPEVVRTMATSRGALPVSVDQGGVCLTAPSTKLQGATPSSNECSDANGLTMVPAVLAISPKPSRAHPKMSAEVGTEETPDAPFQVRIKRKPTESDMQAMGPLAAQMQRLAAAWDHSTSMDETSRAGVFLNSDATLRNYVLSSSTPPTPLMEKVYNATMENLPYAQAASMISGPEQATLLRTMVGLARPRRALDIGSFTGFGSAAILEALPDNSELVCLEINPDHARIAASLLAGRNNVDFRVGKAMNSLKRFEEAGRQFDFILLDADKPMHGEYYEMALKLLRPGGVLVMFGMILFQTEEDQKAIEKLHQSVPKDERVSTAQLPCGCGMQLVVKLDGTNPYLPLSEQEIYDRKRWRLESEVAAIDRHLDALDKPSSGLVGFDQTLLGQGA